MQKNAAVIFDDVSLTIGKHPLLSNISLTIPSQSIFGILGSNGAGKTTLLSLISGLQSPTKGIVSVFGQTLPAQGKILHQKIGVVLQETALYEELTIAENLLFFASLYAIENPKLRIKEVLELLDLSDRARDPVRILSGGLKRRTVIARALLHNPELLLVDEPTLGVDVQTRHAIWEHLRYLRTSGHTILLASNYLDEAQAVCDNVAVLQKGELLISDSPQALIARTGHSLDIECSVDSAKKISHILTRTNSIVRSETTKSGLSLFLRGETVPDTIITTILKTAPVDGFRFRPADLAEVFQALKNNNETTTRETPEQKKSKTMFSGFPTITTMLLFLLIAGLVILEVWLSQPR